MCPWFLYLGDHMQYYTSYMRRDLKRHPHALQMLDEGDYVALMRLISRDNTEWGMDNCRTPNDWTREVNHFCMTLHEVAHLRFGTTVHVADRELLDTLHHSNFDCSVEDLSLPFPVVEFAYPDKYMLPGHPEWFMTGGVAYDGTVLSDMLAEHVFPDIDVNHIVQTEDGSLEFLGYKTLEETRQSFVASALAYLKFYQLTIQQVPWRKGYPMSDGATSLRSSAGCTFADLEKDCPEENERLGLPLPDDMEIQSRAEYIRMTGKLLAYIQTQEYSSALLIPSKQMPHHRKCVGGGLARQLKKRKTVQLLNLFTKQSHYYGENNYTTTGTGHRVCPHIRKHHFRALRHPRFKRNHNGSIKIVPVKASLIHAEQKPAQHERVM
jgi:hypothetical protein